MAYINDAALDAALAEVALSTTLHVCTSQPANFAAVAGVSLGSVAASWGAAGDATGSGRKRTVTPGAGTYGSSGTGSHYALVDGTRLLAAGAMAASKAVNSGDPIQVAAFDIKVNDATAV